MAPNNFNEVQNTRGGNRSATVGLKNTRTNVAGPSTSVANASNSNTNVNNNTRKNSIINDSLRGNTLKLINERLKKTKRVLNTSATSLMTNMTHNIGRIKHHESELMKLKKLYGNKKSKITYNKHENNYRPYIMTVPKNYNLKSFVKTALNRNLENNATSALSSSIKRKVNNLNNENKTLSRNFLKRAKAEQSRLRRQPIVEKKQLLNKSIKKTKKQLDINHTRRTGITIDFDYTDTYLFFRDMYRDMVKDGTASSIEDKGVSNFKNILKFFLNTQTEDINNYFNNMSPDHYKQFKYKTVIPKIQEDIKLYLNETNSTKNITKHENVRPGMQSDLRRYFVNPNKKMRIMLDCETQSLISSSIIQPYKNIELLSTTASILNSGSNMCGFRARANLTNRISGQVIESTPFVYDMDDMDIYLKFTFDNNNKKTVYISVRHTRNKVEIILNDKNVISSSSKKKASVGNYDLKIGKFFGDFLQIVKVLINNKNDRIPTIFASFDMNACVIYKRISTIYVKNKLKILKHNNVHNNMFKEKQRLVNKFGKLIYLQQIGNISNAKYNMWFLGMKDYIKKPN